LPLGVQLVQLILIHPDVDAGGGSPVIVDGTEPMPTVALDDPLALRCDHVQVVTPWNDDLLVPIDLLLKDLPDLFEPGRVLRVRKDLVF